MLIIGLTGGIASGKSAVAAMFEKRGAHVINFDVLARVVVEPDMPAWNDIVAHFGTDILNEDRTLNRAKLGDIVFSDVQQRKTLESFIYPQLFVEYNRRVEEIRSKDPNAIVIADVPLLFEIRLQSMFDKIVVVYATPEQQMKRLIERDGLDHASALKRLNAQMPLEQKMQQADYVIHNTGSLQETDVDVEKTWNNLRRLSE